MHCFDDAGNLVPRASTDGRYGSWNDGVLLNYRRLAVWEWLADALRTLLERYDVDGVRCDIAHALPIMMKRNNAPVLRSGRRSDEDQVEGTVVVNEREDDHFITTGFFDSACRDLIASPLHYLLMRELERSTRAAGKRFSLHLAESYWGREQYLSRVGIVPYDSALFKICERVAQGTSPVSEIYHLYQQHYRRALPPGAELVGMFGNHDERRPVNTFGRDNLRPVLTLTSFLVNLLLDYEGNAQGEAWKVFPDNVYVDWNRFDSAADRSVEGVFREVYAFHRRNPGRGTLVPTDHHQVAAAIKPGPEGLWLAVVQLCRGQRHRERGSALGRGGRSASPVHGGGPHLLAGDPALRLLHRPRAARVAADHLGKLPATGQAAAHRPGRRRRRLRPAAARLVRPPAGRGIARAVRGVVRLRGAGGGRGRRRSRAAAVPG